MQCRVALVFFYLFNKCMRFSATSFSLMSAPALSCLKWCINYPLLLLLFYTKRVVVLVEATPSFFFEVFRGRSEFLERECAHFSLSLLPAFKPTVKSSILLPLYLQTRSLNFNLSLQPSSIFCRYSLLCPLFRELSL